MLFPATRTKSRPNELTLRLLHRITTLILVALSAHLSIDADNKALSADKSSVPNIVVILADDMGFSDVGCYGGEIATPNLDRLAKNGLRFTQMYNTSKCMPSRACLLTGCYAQNVGMARGVGAYVGGVTIGEVLRPAGYRTLFTGKHHSSENPFDRGFDRYFGLRDGACNYFNPGRQRDGEAKPAQKRPNRNWCIDDKHFAPYTPPEKDFYTTDYFTKYALGYLDQYKDEDQPFFLYIAYNAPHDPLHAWPEDIAKYKGRYDAGWQTIRDARYKRQIEMGLFGDNAPISPRESGNWDKQSDAAKAEEARRMEVYAAMVDRMDQNIGKVIAKLEQLGKLDNTLIVFASDNGGSAEVVQIGKGQIGNIDRWSSVKGRWANVSNTPFRKYKNHSHEGGICTPMIVHWPAGITVPRGSIIRTPAHFVDLLPTFADLGKAAYPKKHNGKSVAPLDGMSLAPLLRKEKLARSNMLYWQWSRGRAARDGQWKAVDQGSGWELYDIRADRTELNNLAKAQPDRTQAMADAWKKWYASTAAGKK